MADYRWVYDMHAGHCCGLVTLHWLRVRAGRSRDDLCYLGGRSMSAALCLAIVSRGTYKGCKDIRSWKSDVADWYGVLSHVKGVLWFWKWHRATFWTGGTERWSTSRVVTISSIISEWLLRRQQQYSLAVATTAAVWWWSPLKFRISCWLGIRQRQWRLLGEVLTWLAIVLKLRLFHWVSSVVLGCTYMYVALLCMPVLFSLKCKYLQF